MFGNLLERMNSAMEAAANQTFSQKYRCFPIAAKKQELEEGDKILLPPSALDTLAHLKVDYPMLFAVENPETGRQSHCGVMEFSAEEGFAYLPYWMMQNLLLESGAVVRVTNVSLPLGNYVQFQPHRTAFIELANPKAVLENALRRFSCMTTGDTIVVKHMEQTYCLDVLDVKPGNAVSIIETDVNVDFAPPKDYVEPTRPSAAATAASNSSSSSASSSSSSASSSSSSSSGKEKASTAAAAAPPKSYFERLGSGHSLKDTGNGRQASSLSSSSSMDIDPSSSSSTSQSSAATLSSQISRPTTAGESHIVTQVKGQYTYTYRVDNATKQKRLVSRTVTKSPSLSSSSSGGAIGTKATSSSSSSTSSLSSTSSSSSGGAIGGGSSSNNKRPMSAAAQAAAARIKRQNAVGKPAKPAFDFSQSKGHSLK